MINSEFWKRKKVLVTGHTGFKGSWLSIWLLEMGAEVIGYGLAPYTSRDNYNLAGLSDKIIDIRGDVRDKETLQKVFDEHKPEVVFHLAAQPLVRLSYEKPIETYEINVMGTINVMECIRSSDSVGIGIMITTDKCYENKEQLWGYREDDPMGGHDPYSSSKGAAEIAISSWRRSYFNPEQYKSHGKSIASVRAGNVIGGGDWAQDRIIPDCIRALEKNLPIEIRNPHAVRPWEHVLEPLGGYLLLAEKMKDNPISFAEGWNFGPSQDSIVTVWEIGEKIIKHYGSGTIIDKSDPSSFHEATLLTLDISKACYRLGWRPQLNIDETVRMVSEWYTQYSNQNVYQLCSDQINAYVRVMNENP